MSNLDCTYFWNDSKWTKSRVGIIPARMQPPHVGHLNLILNVIKRFKRLALLTYKLSFSPENPFTVEDRIRWIRLALFAIRGEAKDDICIFVTEGLAKMTDDEREVFLGKMTDQEPFVFVSMNPDVTEHCRRFQYPYMQPQDFDSFINVHPDLQNNIAGNATLIRRCLQEDQPLPTGYLPPGIDEVEVRRLYKKYLG